MESFTLGSDPATMTVKVTRGADFGSVLTNTAGDWNPGAAVELRIGSTVWSATLDGADATFSVDKAAVDAMLSTETARWARLFYVEGASDVLWAEGRVVVNG